MRNFSALILSGLFLGASATASAEQAYFGFGLGEVDAFEDMPNVDETVGKLFLGVEHSEALALEVGVSGLGEGDYSTTGEAWAYDAATMYAAALGRVHVGAAALHVKGGLHYWMLDGAGAIVSGGTTYTGSGEESGIDLMYGIGATVTLSERVAVRAEFERFAGVGDGARIEFPGLGYLPLDGDDLDVVSASLIFRF